MIEDIIKEIVDKYPDEDIEVWKRLLNELEASGRYGALSEGIRYMLNRDASLVELTALKILNRPHVEKSEKILAILLLGKVILYEFYTTMLNAIGPEEAPYVLIAVKKFSKFLDMLLSLPDRFKDIVKRVTNDTIMLLDIAADTAYKTYHLFTVAITILKVAVKAARLAGRKNQADGFEESIKEIQSIIDKNY